MGAWGAEIFENDDACDFVNEVVSSNDLARVEEALNSVTTTDGYLEAPPASEGLAAADVVARLRGRWGNRDEYTKPLDGWVERIKLTPPDKLVEMARITVQRVRTAPSELLELWQEGDPSEWLAALDELAERLS